MSEILDIIKNTTVGGHHPFLTMEDTIYPIRLYSIGSLERQEPINFSHSPNHIVLLCIAGEGQLSLNNEIYTLKEGTGFVITKGTPISYHETKPVFRTFWVSMKGDVVKDILTYKNIFFRCLDLAELAEEWYKILQSSSSHNWAIETSTHLYSFILKLNRQLNYVFTQKNKQDLLFHQIIDYFSYNISEPYSLDTLAEMLHISPGHICRLFRTKYGVTPNKFFENLKIDHAKNLLETTNNKISDIANLCGYSDPNYFSVVFKKNTGLSPTQFKKQTF